MELSEALPTGWELWNAEPGGRVVLAFRPDVFDSETFDPACLPTIKVAPGRSPDRPPSHSARADGWHVVFYLEPQVRVRTRGASEADRETAVERAVDIATAFADGEVDYRAAYQQPRGDYLDRLDELTGGA